MAKIKKRKLRKKIVFSLILLAILLIIGGTKLLQQSSTNYKLHQLNYSNEAIKNINKNHLTQKVIDENIYTKTLEAAFVSNDFKKEYLDIYTEIDYRNNENFINNINNLANIGYKKDDINAIFTYLNNNDIDKINNRDIINNISQYISVSMFKTDNIDRYISYKAKNTNLDYETVISYVNIGLDYPFYDHVTVIKDPDNISVLVNKYYQLPSDFEATDLQKISASCSNKTLYLKAIAKESFEKMCADLKAIGLNLKASSAYRTRQYQKNLYDDYVKTDGFANAEIYSARPDYSEHQTGLAVDVASGTNSIEKFVNSNEFAWMQNNAHKYGFILRYPKGKESITGYSYESWHYRYVGEKIATYIYNNKITYDEYYIKFIEKK